MRWTALVAGVLLAVSGAARAAWFEASSKHFVVYSNDDPAKLRAFTAKLERFDRAMRVLRGMDDPAISPTQRVSVYVLDDVGDIARLYGKGGSDVAGFYDARASGPVAFVPRRGEGQDKYALSPQQVLFHEYAHHLMFSTMGGYYFPPWYVEGFAEFSATAEVGDDGSVLFGSVPLYRLYGIAGVVPMPVKTLLIATPAKLSPEQRETMYGRGWLLTHYLTVDEARRKQLGAYLVALNAGKPAADAAAALGGVNALDRQLDTYIRARLTGFRVPAAKLDPGKVELRPLTPGEIAVMPARLQSTRGVNAKTAPRVAALAEKLAAPYPADAAAQNMLAEAEFDAGNLPAALAAADRAVAADPRSVHALAYRGLVLQARALQAKGAAPEDFTASRAAFVAANHADHDAPWPLELNYLSYVARGQKPNGIAEDGLLMAASLAPYDDSLMMLAAQVMLGRDKPDEAKTYLRPIAFNPHGGDTALLAGKLLALLDAGDKAGATALFAGKDATAEAAKKPN